MNINKIRLGENVYALISKDVLSENHLNSDTTNRKSEVVVVPGIVIGVHVDLGVTIRTDNSVFNVPADFVFYNEFNATRAAVEYNEQFEDVNNQEQEFTVCVHVTGRVLITTKAKDAEMARCKANGKVCDMEFAGAIAIAKDVNELSELLCK